MIVGKLVERAAPDNSCATLRTSRSRSAPPRPHTPAEFNTAALAYLAQHGSLIAHPPATNPPANIFWDDDNYRGDAYPAYAWAVYVAEVAVDTTTYIRHLHRLLRPAGGRQSPPPHPRQGPDRRRRRPGHRLRALRKMRLAKRPHGQQPDDQLHHAHQRRPPAHPRPLRRDPQHPRPLRRQRHRRTPHGRPRPRHPQRHRSTPPASPSPRSPCSPKTSSNA